VRFSDKAIKIETTITRLINGQKLMLPMLKLRLLNEKMIS